MGAWIETSFVGEPIHSSQSHPSWVRGLKRFDIDECGKEEESHPSWVRGLKLLNLDHEVLAVLKSHPSWVRGLKLLQALNTMTTGQSHPSWVRGLKLNVFRRILKMSSRTPRGCVD